MARLRTGGQGLISGPHPLKAREQGRVSSPLCSAFPPLYLKVAMQLEGGQWPAPPVQALDGAGALEMWVPSSDPPAESGPCVDLGCIFPAPH